MKVLCAHLTRLNFAVCPSPPAHLVEDDVVLVLHQHEDGVEVAEVVDTATAPQFWDIKWTV